MSAHEITTPMRIGKRIDAYELALNELKVSLRKLKHGKGLCLCNANETFEMITLPADFQEGEQEKMIEHELEDHRLVDMQFAVGTDNEEERFFALLLIGKLSN